MAAKKKPVKRATVRKAVRILRSAPPLRLDLGSGPRPAEGFQGVDIVPGVTNHYCDLCNGARWKWSDNSVDELRSSHFIEHIPQDKIHTPEGWKNAFFWFFDECFRIAKPGAVFTVQWPALQSVRAFQDPTHSRFIPAETFGYLSIEGRKAMGVEHYGATCNWIGSVNFSTAAPTPEEQKESEAMALRADSSDEKQAWIRKVQAEQGRRYRETWGYVYDFIAVVKAVK